MWLQKLKKNVFLQPVKGSIVHPYSYWETRARVYDNCLIFKYWFRSSVG